MQDRKNRIGEIIFKLSGLNIFSVIGKTLALTMDMVYKSQGSKIGLNGFGNFEWLCSIVDRNTFNFLAELKNEGNFGVLNSDLKLTLRSAFN